MEKTKNASVVSTLSGWSDVGSWNALWETSEKDGNGNVLRGNVIAQETQNCYLRSEHRLVVGLGIKDLIIVETDDAVLIASNEHSQKVKNIVKQLLIYFH